jgi:hypothetical protein
MDRLARGKSRSGSGTRSSSIGASVVVISNSAHTRDLPLVTFFVLPKLVPCSAFPNICFFIFSMAAGHTKEEGSSSEFREPVSNPFVDFILPSFTNNAGFSQQVKRITC